MERHLLDQQIKIATLLSPQALQVDVKDVTLSRSAYSITHTAISDAHAALMKPLREEINAHIERMITREFDRMAEIVMVDGELERIVTGRMGHAGVDEFCFFVKLRAVTKDGLTCNYDIQRSSNPERYKLFEWLDTNLVGNWQTHHASILFTREEDAVLFRMRFAA